ncbi:MAG: peptidoglycan editing factor PgeF [Anaerolineaceae bacterium]|nr:peptidoglycan editing factor PgeF [Anaerolineaceae bacterium]
MPFRNKENLKYYSFDLFEPLNIVHGIFTRFGGVSQYPWKSLNVGGSNADSRENVLENKRRLFSVLGLPLESGFDVWQVHSNKVICVDSPRPLEEDPLKADGIITNQVGMTLFMNFADCVPILLFDPIKRIIGIVHAGRLGTINKICLNAVQAFQEIYNSSPKDILAGIGPSIGPDHYWINSKVIEDVKVAFGQDASKLLVGHNGKIALDLWKANRVLLQQAGVQKIQTAGVCTACHVSDWFSHRAENGNTGRFGAIISLRP